jgi:hypothetical protein
LFPLGVAGQDVSKYLEGAVPVKEGKVVFTREVQAPGHAREALFARVAGMAQDRFKTTEDERGMVLYSDAGEGVVLCRGVEYLVFVQKALVLDRALIDYQVTYTCRDGGCVMEVSRVRYQYGEDTKERYLAEEWITDEHAYNKKRGKLLRGSDKFRIKTIDLVDALEELLRKTLQVPAPASPATREVLPAITSSREGYQRILPTGINGNFIHMLQDGLLTFAGKGEGERGPSTRWGGIGYLFDRPVIYCFTLPTGEERPAGEAYTLHWNPSGASPSLYREVIFECRALVSQPLAPGALVDTSLEGKPLPRLHVGEIVSVWVK